MNEHPTSEELADYLYEELPAEKREALARHLDGCSQCRAEIEAWRGARQALQAWRLHSIPASRASRVPPAFRWAAAAIVMLGIGYGTGRFSRPSSPDLSAMRAELTQQLRGEMKSELQTQMTKFAADEWNQQRQEYQHALVQAASQLEARRLADYASLRQDVETVAYRTEQEFNSLATPEPGRVTPAALQTEPQKP